MKKKIISILLVVIILITTTTTVVFADSYGTSVNVKLEFRDAFQCLAPVNTTYYYFSIITGDGLDFTWTGYKYILIWSTEKLIISKSHNGMILITQPFYYIGSNNLKSLLEIVQTKESGTMTVGQSKGTFEFTNCRVLYSNQEYSIEGKIYPINWIAASMTGHAAFLRTFLDSIYQGLKNNSIILFGTEISFWALLAGPFAISIVFFALNAILGIGDSSFKLGVRVSRNRKLEAKNEERWQRRRAQIREERRSRGK